MRHDRKTLTKNLLVQYFTLLRENLLKLDSNYFEDRKVNEHLNQQMCDFFRLQFEKIPQIFNEVFPLKEGTGYAYFKPKGKPDHELVLGPIKGKKRPKTKNVLLKVGREFQRLGKRIQKKFTSVRVEKVDLLRLFSSLSDREIELIASKILTVHKPQLESLFNSLEKYNQAAGKKCALVSHVFPTTWHPTLLALQEKGWKVATVSQFRTGQHTGYGCMATNEVQSDFHFFTNFLGALLFTLLCKNSPVLFSAEAYHGSNWNSINASFMFLNLGVMLRAVRKLRNAQDNNLILFMYDGLKPVNFYNSKVGESLSFFYRRFMRQGDRILYNSNSERLGDYVENTYGITAPRIHFYRLSETLNSDKKPRLSFGKNGDEFHVVSITSFSDRSCCSARVHTYEAVKAMLEQGIHFHYYTGDSEKQMEWFLELLDRESHRFFHIHPVNRDQQWLINELHQYHAGFNGSDFYSFAQGISELKDFNYRAGLLNFMLSTYGTSFHVYAAAGVPPILPGMCTDSALYYKDFCVEMNLSDFANAKNHFKKINLEKMCNSYESHIPKAAVRNYIQNLIDFMEHREGASLPKSIQEKQDKVALLGK